jgi:triacylglycerol lipase
VVGSRRIGTTARVALLVAVLAGALLLALARAAPAPAAEGKLPVPWTFDAGLAAQAAAPNSPPAGANDFSCRPTRRHPEPVVLVHGLLANRTVNWATISPFLKNRGFCVFALTYGTRPGSDFGFYQPGGLRRMQASARQLRRFVKRVLRRTGARKVDIVGHSEGSLMPSWYVRKLGGGRRVDDYVGLTTLWQGTNPAGMATLSHLADTFGVGGPLYRIVDSHCVSCRQFLHGSAFLKKLHRRGVTARRVTYTSIVTRYDQLVFPYTSGLLPKARNVTNVVLQRYCSLDGADHIAVAADPVTAGFVHRALDPERAPKPPCVPVVAGVGAPGYSSS